jgi:hypothetical protein
MERSEIRDLSASETKNRIALRSIRATLASSRPGYPMSEEQVSDTTPSTNIEAAVAEDKRSMMLRLGSGEGSPLVAALDTASVEALISAAGAARAQMLEPIPPDLIGTFPLTACDPRWYVTPDNKKRLALFWIRHPGFGWSIYGFSRHEAANIAKWLRKVTTITSTRDTQSPAATSFGGDNFLLTTEGLGFYYYGKGEKRIGPNPFEQVEFDSDRAAGIVAGSIAELRLEQALRSRLRTGEKKIELLLLNLFRPSGALGPFSTKVDLAYLMGVLSDDAHKDLEPVLN